MISPLDAYSPFIDDFFLGNFNKRDYKYDHPECIFDNHLKKCCFTTSTNFYSTSQLFHYSTSQLFHYFVFSSSHCHTISLPHGYTITSPPHYSITPALFHHPHTIPLFTHPNQRCSNLMSLTINTDSSKLYN